MSGDMYFKKVCSVKYLEQAFQHLKTSQNLDYKNYYRNLFIAYELALKENLQSLSDRLVGYSYQPSSILRFYKPKYSGLHRPLTLLHIEDQIVYQSLAIVFAEKFKKQRKDVEYTYVFSNILNEKADKNIFFLRKWQHGYRRFISTIKKYFEDGNTWVAHFDLAAYYDTIDHILLSEQFSRETYTDYTDLLKRCLQQWSTHKNKKFNHGIPQGPVSSNIISDIFLLPIDKVMLKNDVKYLRYVDDIRLFGKTRDEVLNSIIILEKECRERGLIPQSKKYAIKEANTLDEAIGKFPSLTEDERETFFSDIKEDEEEVSSIFKKAFDENNFDLSRIRYILRVTFKNDGIRDTVLNKIVIHPELCDEFEFFLQSYFDDRKVINRISNILQNNIMQHEYAEGKYWELLSKFNLSEKRITQLRNTAYQRLTKSYNQYSIKYGIFSFLCLTGQDGVLNWIKNESSSLLQSFSIPWLAESHYNNQNINDVVNALTNRSNFEPALVLLKEAMYRGENKIVEIIGEKYNDVSGIIQNTLGKPAETDSIGQIISTRYKIKYTTLWNQLLSDEYKHANTVLYHADKAYYSDRSVWVNNTDSFNDIIVRKLILEVEKYDSTIQLPKTIDINGKLISYGRIIKNDLFTSRYSRMSELLLQFHERRSKTITSHAYDQKTLVKTSVVTGKEQKELYLVLKELYELFVIELEKIFK